MSGARSAGLIAVLPLYLAIATAIGYVDYQVRSYPEKAFTEYLPYALAGKAEPPAKYRVLAPQAYAALARLTHFQPVYTFVFFRWLCLVAAFVAGHFYFRTWFDSGGAVAGNAIIAALLPLTFTNSWANPDQFTELVLFTLGCLCIARGWTVAFAIALAVNAFNRETSVFLLPLFFFAAPLSRRHVIVTAGLTALWFAIYAGLRWQLGYQAYDVWQFTRNLEFLKPLGARPAQPYYAFYGWFFLILAVPMFWLAARSWNAQPRVVRVATAVVAPLFLVVSFIASSVIESRIFTPLLPLLVPGVLFALYDVRAR